MGPFEKTLRPPCVPSWLRACSLRIQIKKQFSIRSRSHWDYIFCGIFDPTAVLDCTKFFSLITNVLLQLVRDIINGVCYQRYQKYLEQQKGRANVNVCAAEENLEEELYLNQYSILSFQSK